MHKTISLKQYIEDYYLPFYKRKLRKELNYKKELTRINVIMNSDFALEAFSLIKRNDIVLFLAFLAKERQISKSTINRYRTRLMAIFNYGLENGDINYNPVTGIKKNKEYSRSKYLSLESSKLLIKECLDSRNKDLYIIVVLALNTGMRVGEILNLEYKNLKDDGIYLFGEQTKSGFDRFIPLADSVRIVLNEYISDYSRVGKLFKIKSIRCAFDYAKERAGVDCRFHDLCRTFATHLKNANVDIHTISKLLGHSSIVTTEIYLGTDHKKLLDSVKVLEFI